MILFDNTIDLTGLAIEDEFGRVKIESKTEYAIDGTPIVFQALKKDLKLVLYGGEDWGWLDKNTISALFTRANYINTTFPLNINSYSTTVRFDHDTKNPIQAIPVGGIIDGFFYNNIKIFFVEIL